MTATRFKIEVRPRLPESLARLEELANDLIYSWDRDLRRLFRLLDNDLYDHCQANLKVFLRQIAQERLDAAAADPSFMGAYHRVLSSLDAYRNRRLPPELAAEVGATDTLVAYFCFEFGFHESLPLYSGGLGILAADHCKAASDLAVPLVGVGLMYHDGFFEQEIDRSGRQVEHYVSTDVGNLPVTIVRDDRGEELRVDVPIGACDVQLRVWRVDIGNVRLFLLDSDLEVNPDPYRTVTRRLYDGAPDVRIRQEAVLGIGGVRALRAMGIEPGLWHLNEGHPAFLILERIREATARGQPFDVALERVAAATVFTTHTPVSAGHDVFSWDQVMHELGRFIEQAGFDPARLRQLGHNAHTDGLNMTALALRGSRRCNGVSRIHRDVAARNEGFLWPQVPPAENPFQHVTNGVHLPTFLALEWVNQFDMSFPDWRGHLTDEDFWRRVETISDPQFLAVRQELKQQLLTTVAARLRRRYRREGIAEGTIERLTAFEGSADVLVLGFARRFATYKRATLIFGDPPRLARLLNDPARPVILLMAGKAHPHDEPGKQLIQQVHELSQRPEFMGRVHLVENYDMALARTLVAGVDVWLNTPEHPLEASGTSGMKAAMNGVLNLSVLDGWWAEAYDGTNGWGIKPHGPGWDQAHRTHEEADDLLQLLEQSVVPTYFERRDRWIAMAKRSMRTIIPKFNAERMVRDYLLGMYGPALRQSRRLGADGAAVLEDLVAWKGRVQHAWPGVSARRVDRPPEHVNAGERVHLEVEVELNGLHPEDLVVECIVTSDVAGRHDRRVVALSGEKAGDTPGADPAKARYALDFQPPFSGAQNYWLRVYPHHAGLAHPFELGCLIWI